MNSITDLLSSENEYYDSQSAPGFVQGTVVENNNSKFKGMVKVEFTVWEKGKNMCEWVRLISPYAGKDYGTYVVPEIGEVVLIGFIGGSLKRPFLLASLYPSGADIVNNNFNDKNYMKRITTKGGTDILINDEDGKQKITVTTKKGSLIEIDDEKECCNIKDKDGKNSIILKYKDGEIAVTADKKISFKTGKTEISMDGSGGALNVKADKIQIEGTNQVSIAGKQALKLEGAQVDVKGQSTIKVQSSAQLVLKGSMTQIN